MVATAWQVSMVRQAASDWTPDVIQTLAAPQQLPVPHPPNSPLFGLKVPLERAFSHLAPTVPAAGVVCPLRSFSMASSFTYLAALAALKVFKYASNLAVWHVTVAVAKALVALFKASSAPATFLMAASRSPC